MNEPPLNDLIEGYRLRVEKALERYLPTVADPPERLHAAMRYAVLGGGKRVRPLQVYLTGESLGIEPAVLDGPAWIAVASSYARCKVGLPRRKSSSSIAGRSSWISE